MPLSFFRDTVVRQRAVLRKKNGMEYQDWSDPDELTITNCQLTAQATTREFEGRLLNVTDRRTLRANYDADIKAGDRIVWDGETYEIDGEVFHTKSPTGRISTTRCTLVRWNG